MEAGSTLLETWTVTLFAAVLLQIVASRLKLPAIVFLLLGGILLGPEVASLIHPEALGEGLETVISLAVAVILFEGGLTLNVSGFRLSPVVIRRMLTIGVAITWLGTALAIYVLFDFSPVYSALAASLCIVTGPTVIGPILRRVRVEKRVHQILHWESVLIDPIGVFIALGCFEWYYFETTLSPVMHFGARLGVGILAGWVAGRLLRWVLRNDWIDQSLDNLFIFSSALVIFGLCDMVLSESGLMAVTVAGLVLGRCKSPRIKDIKAFKLDVTKLAIGVLFVLLAARLDLSLFLLLGWQGLLLLALIMFVVRPLNVFASSVGTDLRPAERLFLSSLAPRGIVAASMASLFTLRLSAYTQQAWFLEVFTYAVIGVTVIIQGLSAPLNARIMGVSAPPRGTWLIVGGRAMGRALARVLTDAGKQVKLVDINRDNVERAQDQGFEAYHENIVDEDLIEDSRFSEVGALLCTTGNAALDDLACHRWTEVVPSNRAFRMSGSLQTPDAELAASSRSGHSIWNRAVPLREIEHEIETGEATVRIIEVTAEAVRGDGIYPLFALDGADVEIVDDLDLDERWLGREMVVIDRRRVDMAALVRALVFIDDEQPDQKAVLERLFQETARLQPDIDQATLVSRLMSREVLMPSYVGRGVSIPHTYSEGTGEPLCVVGRIAHGIEASTFDKQPIRLVFLLISPVGKAEKHLEALGRLARAASNIGLIESVMQAESEDEAMHILHDYHILQSFLEATHVRVEQ